MDSLERENKEFFDRFAAYYDRSALKKWLISLQKKSLWEINFGKNSSLANAESSTILNFRFFFGFVEDFLFNAP